MHWNLKNILKKIRKRTVVRKRSLINISRDWMIILIAFALLNVVSIGANIHLLISAGSVDVYTSAESGKVETIDRTALKNILQTYTQKQERLEALIAQPPQTSDPAQ